MNNNLEKRIINLVNKISSLPEQDKKNIIEFAENNEWGIALDTLCNQIYEYGIVITQSIYDEIVIIGNEMEMEYSTWDFLEELTK